MQMTKDYIGKIKDKFNFEQIAGCLEKPSNLKVLAIGDAIIDYYVFVTPKGRAVKDPILSVEHRKDELYVGGILAIANHLNDFVKKIKLVTLVGDKNDKLDFIKQSLKGNVELKTFAKKNSPTTIKKRFVDIYRNNKLFKIEYLNDEPIVEDLRDEIIAYLDEEIPKYDLVVVGDFGHGFIDGPIRKKLEEKSKFLALNAQSNSSNLGYNYFNLYKRMDFISMNEHELRLPLLRRFEKLDEVIKETYAKFKPDNILLTRGKEGSIFVNQGNNFEAPALITNVKDTVGAGDAVFAIASLLVNSKIDNELIPFISNCVGGIAVNFIGNKEFVTKDKLLNFVKALYKNGLEKL